MFRQDTPAGNQNEIEMENLLGGRRITSTIGGAESSTEENHGISDNPYKKYKFWCSVGIIVGILFLCSIIVPVLITQLPSQDSSTASSTAHTLITGTTYGKVQLVPI